MYRTVIVGRSSQQIMRMEILNIVILSGLPIGYALIFKQYRLATVMLTRLFVMIFRKEFHIITATCRNVPKQKIKRPLPN